MTYKVIFSLRALHEIKDAWHWYENKVIGLGDKFKQAIFEKIHEIELDPTKELLRKPPFREAIINIFPYLIIFRIDEDEKLIFVHSIFHTSRNPRKKYK